MVHINVDLTGNRAFAWYKAPDCAVKGAAFLGGVLLTGNALAEYFGGVSSREDAVSRILKLNGFFSVVLMIDGSLFAAVDHMRSFTLFWKLENNTVYLFDDMGEDKARSETIDEDALSQFKTSLFVAGRKTLFLGIRQIEAGEYLWVGGKEIIEQGIYYDYPQNKYLDSADTVIYRALDCAYQNASQRLIGFLDGRTAVIPLSGGHDSRIIAYYLKKAGYHNVIAYSYGKPDNEESKVSQRVAEFLEIPWHFVEYGRSEMRKFYKSGYRSFAFYCGSCVSVPCTQEWFAVKTLLSRGVIDQSCVLVPGYSGDFLAGSQITQANIENRFYTAKAFQEELLNKYFSELPLQYWAEPRRNLFISEINEVLSSLQVHDQMNTDDVVLRHDYFIWKEKISKFVCNTVRTYEFYDLQWYMPLWDKELVEIWSRISPTQRYQRGLYCSFVDWLYPDLMRYAPVASKGVSSGNKKPRFYGLCDLWPFHYAKSLIRNFNSHYLFGFVSISSYLFTAVRLKSVSINLFFKNDYLRYIMNLAKWGKEHLHFGRKFWHDKAI
jgi:asparagine synthase (glutamine-hydrolysing)